MKKLAAAFALGGSLLAGCVADPSSDGPDIVPSRSDVLKTLDKKQGLFWVFNLENGTAFRVVNDPEKKTTIAGRVTYLAQQRFAETETPVDSFPGGGVAARYQEVTAKYQDKVGYYIETISDADPGLNETLEGTPYAWTDVLTGESCRVWPASYDRLNLNYSCVVPKP